MHTIHYPVRRRACGLTHSRNDIKWPRRSDEIIHGLDGSKPITKEWSLGTKQVAVHSQGQHMKGRKRVYGTSNGNHRRQSEDSDFSAGVFPTCPWSVYSERGVPQEAVPAHGDYVQEERRLSIKCGGEICNLAA